MVGCNCTRAWRKGMPADSNGFASVGVAPGLAGFAGVQTVPCSARSTCGAKLDPAQLPADIAVQISYPQISSPTVFSHAWPAVLASAVVSLLLVWRSAAHAVETARG